MLFVASVLLIAAGAALFFLVGVATSKVAKNEITKLGPTPTAVPTAKRFSFGQLKTEQIDPSKIKPFVTGIGGLHGLGLFNGNLYVSSWAEKKIYKVDIATGQRKLLADELNGAHDMVQDGDGSIVTPLFNENRVVKINSQTGQVKTVATGFDGPNGIAKARSGGYYISNAKSGTVSKINPDGTVHQVAANLKEPAGIISDPDNILYVAQFADPINSVIQVFDNGKVQPLVGGMTNAETLLRDEERNVIVGDVVNGKAAMSYYPRGGTTARTVLVTELPGPMVGPVTDGTYLYFESAGGDTVYRVPLP